MTTDKIDNHYFQQLSALVDGDLAPDQARFLLRRMEHDTELSGCLERWQLCGDVLRGQARAPAPADFAGRVAAAIAAESLQPTAKAASSRYRGNLAKWGGGALAASVAAIALFMVRQQVPDETPAQAAPTVASQAPVSNNEAGSTDPGIQGEGAAVVTAASVAVASIPRRQDDARRSATRNQQAARMAAITRAVPDRAVASAAAPPSIHATSSPAIASAPTAGAAHDPFSNVQINAPAARPWPRAVLPQYSGSGAFNTGYSTDRAAETFYPFEPRLPVAVPEPARQD
ncbi:MAG: sigma-E factor negative regulatory protein [Pseudoxanthomonas sp.]